MENPFNKQNPRVEAQFEDVSMTKECELLSTAFIEAEGFILYTPIAKEHKETLLSALTDITESDIRELNTLLRRKYMTEDQAAETIMQRKLRGTVDSLRAELKERDYDMLCLGVGMLANKEPSSFDESYKQWMQSRSEL